jgi:hypothetical protein
MEGMAHSLAASRSGFNADERGAFLPFHERERQGGKRQGLASSARRRAGEAGPVGGAGEGGSGGRRLMMFHAAQFTATLGHAGSIDSGVNEISGLG